MTIYLIFAVRPVNVGFYETPRVRYSHHFVEAASMNDAWTTISEYESVRDAAEVYGMKVAGPLNLGPNTKMSDEVGIEQHNHVVRMRTREPRGTPGAWTLLSIGSESIDQFYERVRAQREMATVELDDPYA